MGLEGIQPGAVNEAIEMVTPDLAASHIGSGNLRVYATPAMALLVEKTCWEMAQRTLPEGQTTVGVEICVRHLAPTPVGSQVRIRAEIIQVEDPFITFHAQVWDEFELVGEVQHQRVVIDVERFLKRVRKKAFEKNDKDQEIVA